MKKPNLITTIEQITHLDLTQAPSLESIFTDKKIELKPVEGVHVGLISSENLYSNDQSEPKIAGIWLQGIDKDVGKKNGRVKEHDHGAERISEVIITEDNSVYAGLGKPIAKESEYAIYLVPAGIKHGSDHKPSYGRWVSIKFKS